ncbi:transporter substrate-binding domain-containing protein [Amaricoccus tamworthensis]|uniref:transporter substrate-binding domain-containing protein n=1 Tax=Amaricoccus tamworthensis TaxID=57002 RepID=UPI003C7E894F
MNRLIANTAATLLALGLATSALAQSALNDILDGGVLKVGTTGDWNPMTLRDPASNSYKGFDIDVMTELANDLGVEIEFVATDWKTLVNGIVAGNYHITGSASVSPARMKAAGFSESYLSVEFFPFAMNGNVGNFDGWDSINQEDVTVATTLGTSFEAMTRAWFPDAELKVVEAPARGFQEVIAGRADVFVTSNIEGATLTEKFDIARVPNTEPREPTPIAMLLPQDDQVWINYVNNWIKLKQAQGFFEGVRGEWGL